VKRLAWFWLTATGIAICVATDAYSGESGKFVPAPLPKEGVAATPSDKERLEALLTASARYWKTPFIEEHNAAFHKAIEQCLWSHKPEIRAAGFRSVIVCDCFLCARALERFIFDCEGRNRAERNTLMPIAGEARALLYDMRVDHIYDFNNCGDLGCVKRSPKSQVRYLRSLYWTSGTSGDLTPWLVGRLALVNDASVGEALDDIEKDASKGEKSREDWELGQFAIMLKHARQLNAEVRRADSPMDGLKNILLSEDRKLVHWGIDVAQRLSVRRYGQDLRVILEPVVARHEALLKAAPEATEKELDETNILKRLRAIDTRLPTEGFPGLDPKAATPAPPPPTR